MKLSFKSLRKWLLVQAYVFAFVSSIAQTGPEKKDSLNNDAIVVELTKGVLISGTITDAATRRPVPAISITYQNYSAAITDSIGNFSLKVPNHNVAVVVKGEGYQVKEVALKGREKISIVLYEDTYTSFYDAANLPFASVSGSHVPFAATSIQTGGNWGRTAESPDAFLQGKVAGLHAIRRSGTPGIGANLFVRGYSSLYATNQPLVVVDGVIFDIEDYGGSLISNNYTNPLAYLDVKDIDNITVIKDGSSIYGTKGANGVIMIRTARAKELATRIDFAVYGGINFAPKNLPVLNAADYRVYLSDILQSGGMSQSQVNNLPYMNDNPSNPDYYRYHSQTDWQNKVFDNSSLKNYYLKVTGGDNIAKYALSLGFLTNSGVTRQTDMNRYNTRFNADLNLSRRLTAAANLSFSYHDQNLKDQGLSEKTNPIYAALIKSPFIAVNEINEKGIESPDITDTDTFKVSNPVALINNMQGINKNYRFFGSIGFNYALSKFISLNTVTGITVDKVRENSFIPRRGVGNDTLADGTIADSRLGSQTKRILAIYNDTRIAYENTFQHIHHLSARLGVRFQQSKVEQDIALGANSATDQLVSVGNSVSTLRRTGGDIGEYRWLNTYLNADYSMSDKYFLSVNVAMDGSSRFGNKVSSGLSIGENSYALLPSVAAAWLISSEKFMADNRFIDLLKLRASIGLSGNDDIGNYSSRQTYVSQNFLGMQGLVRANVGNDQLQWERISKINAGLDIAFFNERLNVSVDAYQNKTNEMIVFEPIQTAAGLKYALTNTGAMKTNGIEAGVTGRIINRPALKWDLGLTIAHYASTLTKLPGDGQIFTDYAGATIYSHVTNEPNIFYGYKSNGVYSTDAEASADGLTTMLPNGSTVAFKGGDIRFSDLDGNKIIDDRDRQIIGNPNPDFFGSIFNRVEWKRWSLEGLFTFSSGNDIYNYTRRQLESQSTTNNQTTAVINRWRTNGQVTNIPRASLGDPAGNSRFSDRWIEDGSYFRLRTATLSYNIPFKAGFLRYSVIYVTGNNLFTLTNYLGYDPEMSSTVSTIGQGVDITLEPQHRSVQVGVRFGL